MQSSQRMRHKHTSGIAEGQKCSSCNKMGHLASRCYLRDRKDSRVNQFAVKNVGQEKSNEVTCFNCQGRGHMAKHCEKPKKRFERPGFNKDRTKESTQ